MYKIGKFIKVSTNSTKVSTESIKVSISLINLQNLCQFFVLTFHKFTAVNLLFMAKKY